MPRAGSPPDKESASARVRLIADRALELLADQLKAGNSEQIERYLRAMGRFHQYSFHNLMLILSQRPDASRVAGFHTWRKLGRSVRRGEKGIAIFAPMRLRGRSAHARDDETADPEDRLVFRVVHVFDISQTDGEPLPEPSRVTGDPEGSLDALLAAVRAAGITVERFDSLDGSDGVSMGGRILLRTGLAPAEEFAVLVHEWAHEILHKDDREARPSKTVRETEAEAVAFVVSQGVGLETNTASSDYICLYDGDTGTLTASLDRIQKAACAILEAIETDEPRSQSEPTGAVLMHSRESRISR